MISPHLDDGVFSCGTLMAMHSSVTVVTVFAGIPMEKTALPEWDRLAGFNDAREAMLSRREEDRKALHVFSAHPVWLDFLDSQYQAQASVDALRAMLEEVIAHLRPQHIFFPAGLFHSDHELVHRTVMKMYRSFPQQSWWMYEEALYRRIPGLLQQRLVQLLGEGVRATPISLCDKVGMELKRVGAQRYVSQLRALKYRTGSYGDIFEAERYWRLEDA